MKVKLAAGSQYHDGEHTYGPGCEIDVPEPVAKGLIQGNSAVPVEDDTRPLRMTRGTTKEEA